ncbi:MAG: hypothetical protein KDK22_07720, partial [Rhodobacteraceae bacterium]|nr:hypothetical protein [Paracoccaceae bacterium]
MARGGARPKEKTMSNLLDRLNFFQSKEVDTFANGHGQVTRESRDWEDTYRNRWRHDK